MNVEVPELGENVDEAEVLRIMVSEGDRIEEEDPIMELQTDKASTEMPSPAAGRVSAIRVSEGDTVTPGQVVIELDTDEEEDEGPDAGQDSGREDGEEKRTKEERDQEDADSDDQKKKGEREDEEDERSDKPEDDEDERDEESGQRDEEHEGSEKAEDDEDERDEESEKAEDDEDEGDEGSDKPEDDEDERDEEREKRKVDEQQHAAQKRAAKKRQEPPVPAGPATRRFAREAGVDLRRVAEESTGKRVTRKDVKAYLRKHRDRRQQARREPMSRIRRKSAERLAQAWREIPHVTHHDEADVTELERGRRKLREREPELPLTVTSIVAKAVAVALRERPRFNASLEQDAGELIIHPSIDLGIAVDTEDGLLVPVLRDADRKSMREIANEIAELAERARSRDLSSDELSGSTFSITNLGGIGGVGFSPIINPPEVAILGVSQTRKTVVLDVNGDPEERLALPLSLSYDHRAIDGAAAARFTRRLATLLESPMAILLES